jgi:16S rRNA (cytidine1402-2'-O)-methyltransferase
MREGSTMPLVLVPTPLGNLRDITLRALDTLRDAELVVAEDTRVTQRLFSALDLPHKPMWSYREQNAERVTEAILARAANELVVVVSDAGLPGISDPGRGLVAAARVAGIGVEVLPGPTAFACVAVLSGFDLEGFSFEGFVPRQISKRERAFRDALARGRTSLWYEAPGRIVETLATIERIDASARVFLARELTKKFEQQVLGTAHDVALALDLPPRGEIAFALEARADNAARAAILENDESFERALERACASDERASEIARRLAERYARERGDVYDLVVETRAVLRDAREET